VDVATVELQAVAVVATVHVGKPSDVASSARTCYCTKQIFNDGEMAVGGTTIEEFSERVLSLIYSSLPLHGHLS
jgi:hypothetical protein